MLLNALIVTTSLMSLLLLSFAIFSLRTKLLSILTKQALSDHQLSEFSQLLHSNNQVSQMVNSNLTQLQSSLLNAINELRVENQKEQYQFRQNFDKHQFDNFKALNETWQSSSQRLLSQITNSLITHTKTLDDRVEKLTQETSLHLKEISHQVEKRLSEGFEKTTATFSDVVKRLALIDAAQQKITELSSNVVCLQEILSDKRSRGAFGEVQLTALVRNVLPENHFQFQATLSNGKRVDCLLFLPEPTGNVAIDAKFPLENFRTMMNIQLSEPERKAAEQQFRVDIRKHIQDIADKYIIPGETSDGALMFIPAEAIFAEIHSHYPDLVEIANRSRVWLVSPTTLMAILTTARSVLKDVATRKQIHIIQEHLRHLSADFNRFQDRMQKLGKHIEQAHQDVKDVQTSAQKIHSRFGKIEKAELEEPQTVTGLEAPIQEEQ